MQNPRQLVALTTLLEKALDGKTTGTIAEIGCAAGHTTVFIARHLHEIGFRGTYVAYDTFEGFVAKDIEKERELGTPHIARLRGGFTLNSKRWVNWMLLQNTDIHPVTLMRLDASSHHFDELERDLLFVFIDVDVYNPTRNALERTYSKMGAGGIVVLDDCRQDERGLPVLGKFGGGHRAVLEFCKHHGLELRYIAGKLAYLERDRR